MGHDWWNAPAPPVTPGGSLLPTFSGQGGKLVAVKSDESGLEFLPTGSAATNAAADGSTKGIAAFTAADFNASSGVISLDYTNGQAADGSHKGYLTAADWTTFNGKEDALGFTAEDVANKSTDTALGTSDTLYPSQKAVKAYVDANAGGSLAIGADVTDGTAGSVLYVDADGQLAQNPTGLSWDDDLTQLALGAIADVPDLAPSGAGLSIFEPTSRAFLTLITANGYNNAVTFATQEGTFAEPLPSLAGDEIAELDFLAYRGYGTPGLTLSALLEVDVDAIAVDTAQPVGRISLSTRGQSDSNLHERVRITSWGTTSVNPADQGDAAQVQIGAGVNGTIIITLTQAGAYGNAYDVQLALAETPDASLDVTLSGGRIAITLGTDAEGNPADAKNTAALIADAINALEHYGMSPFSAGATGTGGDALAVGDGNPVAFSGGRDGSTIVTAGKIEMQGLPTSDPLIAGQLWVDTEADYVLKVSQGD